MQSSHVATRKINATIIIINEMRNIILCLKVFHPMGEAFILMFFSIILTTYY